MNDIANITWKTYVEQLLSQTQPNKHDLLISDQPDAGNGAKGKAEATTSKNTNGNSAKSSSSSMRTASGSFKVTVMNHIVPCRA